VVLSNSSQGFLKDSFSLGISQHGVLGTLRNLRKLDKLRTKEKKAGLKNNISTADDKYLKMMLIMNGKISNKDFSLSIYCSLKPD